MRVNGLFGWVRRNDARSAAFLIGFALLSQPMAMVVLFFPLVFVDPAHAPWYNWTGYAIRYAPLVALVAAGYFLAQMWLHVNAVRRDVAFRFVDNADAPRLCGLIEPLAIAAGLKAPYVGVIERRAMNAFACGVTSRFSVAVFTRGLIDGLDDDELSAVIAHELVHIRNGDTRLIAAANVFMRTLSLLERANVIKPRRYRQIAVMLMAPVLFPLYLGVALLAHLFVRLGHASRLLISSAREFVADAEAVRLTQDPAALVSALRRIHGNSAIAGLPPEQDAMMIDGAARGPARDPSFNRATRPSDRRNDRRHGARCAAQARHAPGVRPGSTRRRSGRGQAGLVDTQSGPRARARRGDRAAPKQSALGAFLSVGEDGELGVFGLRWDMAAAMLATFCAAAILHHGDMLGFLGGVGHALDRPDAGAQQVFDKVRGCYGAELTALVGGKPQPEACDAALDVVAKFRGVNVLGDGRVLTDSQMLMLSPDELGAAKARAPGGPSGFSGVFKYSGFSAGRTPGASGVVPSEAERPASEPATDLAASYPLPLHAAWMRLANGDLTRYLRSQQCGLLIHVQVDTETDQTVTWRITSEGEERIRFTAELTADGAEATRVKLYVSDRQPRKTVCEGDRSGRSEPVVFRPALSAPLRPAFSEALAAMLEDRLFRIGRVHNGGAYLPGDGMTAGMCLNQRDRLVIGSEHFSIHDRRRSDVRSVLASRCAVQLVKVRDVHGRARGYRRSLAAARQG